MELTNTVEDLELLEQFQLDKSYPEIDVPQLRFSAREVADSLLRNETVVAQLEPNDMTRYAIMFVPRWHLVVGGAPFPDHRVAPGEHGALVSLVGPAGYTYPWSGYPTHPSYTRGHWTKDDHTAKILALFMTLVAWTMEHRG